ncbi:MAG: hypothetical protein ABJC89_10625 [Acidobacteriota bacterium]
MIGAALLPIGAAKEARALIVPWLACMAIMVVAPRLDSPGIFGGVAAAAYVLGVAALGALSIGHEYTGRTLSLLLSMPASRQHLLLVKAGVLGAMLMTLSLVSRMFVFPPLPGHIPEHLAVLVLPVLCGLCLAPWLTMVCRSAIPGAVFTVVIPSMLWLLGERIGVRTYGRGPQMEAFRLTFLWSSMVVLCAIGAVAGWRTFMRLEAIEGPSQDLQLPRWVRSPLPAGASVRGFTRRNPVWQLVRKELRLQQMTLVVSGLYIVSCIVSSIVTPLREADDLFTIATVLCAFLLALMAGSFASAGERQLGTLESQILLPPSSSRQWTVKVAVVIGLAMLLALGVPAIVVAVAPGLEAKQLLRPGLIVATVLLSAGSLYVSSVCSTGLWALLMSVPAALGAVTFVRVVSQWAEQASHAMAVQTYRWPGLPGFAIGRARQARTADALAVVLVAGLVVALLRFAFANHRSADRAPARVWRQTLLVAAFATAGMMLIEVVSAIHR